jgi:hypothetical protein
MRSSWKKYFISKENRKINFPFDGEMKLSRQWFSVSWIVVKLWVEDLKWGYNMINIAFTITSSSGRWMSLLGGGMNFFRFYRYPSKLSYFNAVVSVFWVPDPWAMQGRQQDRCQSIFKYFFGSIKIIR